MHAPGWACSAEPCIEKALLAWKSRWQAIGCIAELTPTPVERGPYDANPGGGSVAGIDLCGME